MRFPFSFDKIYNLLSLLFFTFTWEITWICWSFAYIPPPPPPPPPPPVSLWRICWFPHLTVCTNKQENRETPAEVWSPLLSSSPHVCRKRPFKFPHRGREDSTACIELLLKKKLKNCQHLCCSSVAYVPFHCRLPPHLWAWFVNITEQGPRQHRAQREDERGAETHTKKKGAKHSFKQLYIKKCRYRGSTWEVWVSEYDNSYPNACAGTEIKSLDSPVSPLWLQRCKVSFRKESSTQRQQTIPSVSNDGGVISSRIFTR